MDATQDSVPALRSWFDAVGDGEAEGADVVGDYPEGDIDLKLRISGECDQFSIVFRTSLAGKRAAVFLPAQLLDLIEQRPKNVRFVVRNDAVEVSESFCVLDY